MTKTRGFIALLLAAGTASAAFAQTPVQLKFSRIVDLTIPIESNMPGIPGLKLYRDKPSQVDIISANTAAQKELLQSEGMTLNNKLEINGRSMISILSILVHNGTHIDAPRHMTEKGYAIDQLPLAHVAKEG